MPSVQEDRKYLLNKIRKREIAIITAFETGDDFSIHYEKLKKLYSKFNDHHFSLKSLIEDKIKLKNATMNQINYNPFKSFDNNTNGQVQYNKFNPIPSNENIPFPNYTSTHFNAPNYNSTHFNAPTQLPKTHQEITKFPMKDFALNLQNTSGSFKPRPLKESDHMPNLPFHSQNFLPNHNSLSTNSELNPFYQQVDKTAVYTPSFNHLPSKPQKTNFSPRENGYTMKNTASLDDSFRKISREILEGEPFMTIKTFELCYNNKAKTPVIFQNMSGDELSKLFESMDNVKVWKNLSSKNYELLNLAVVCYPYRVNGKCECGLNCSGDRNKRVNGWRTKQCSFEKKGEIHSNANCNMLHTTSLYV